MLYARVPLGQLIQHCVGSTKVMGLNPRGHKCTCDQMYILNAMQVSLDKYALPNVETQIYTMCVRLTLAAGLCAPSASYIERVTHRKRISSHAI